jgi:putative FmdB family regulatory protein
MPTYEYRCPEGHDFEQFQRMSDPPEAICPRCGAKAQRLLSGGAGLIFKGSGFYLTDYRSESYRKAAEAEAKGGSSSTESGGGAAGGEKSPGGTSAAGGTGSGSSPSTDKPSSGGGQAGTSGGSAGGSGSKTDT